VSLLKKEYVRDDFVKIWDNSDVFEQAKQQQGDIFRDKEGRRTLKFEKNGKTFFLKLHQGIGWKEIIKNVLQLRMPIIGAQNEWQAIKLLEQHHIDTLAIAAYGQTGINPAKQLSFLVTDEIQDSMSLEHLGEQWKKMQPSFQTKQALIKKLALISKTMHENGVNHRDYYLCHFLLDTSFAQTNIIADDTRLVLIDLHRAQIRRKVPERWLVKDIGSLYFSALDIHLTKRDLFRFITRYSGLPLREALMKQQKFWTKVDERAVKLRNKQR
jgi:lipopolysaccharide core heptose(I) kinase